jgi:hypothetical protein
LVVVTFVLFFHIFLVIFARLLDAPSDETDRGRVILWLARFERRPLVIVIIAVVSPYT